MPPEPFCLPWRLFLLWLGGGLLVLAAFALLELATHFHLEYAYAPVEPFYQRAQYAANSIVLVCIVALIVTWKTRHPISLAALVICIAVFVNANAQTGIRY